MAKETEANYKGTWTCEACGNKVIVYIQLVQPPICANHIRGGKVMKQQ